MGQNRVLKRFICVGTFPDEEKSMKKPFKLITAALALTLTMTACGGLNNATELGTPKEVKPLGYSEAAQTDTTLRDAAKDFAARFSAEAVKGQEGNTAVSPVSVYLALGLAAQCAAGETKEELLNTLKIDDISLKNGYSDFYRSIIAEHTNDGKVTARVDVGNSIWVQEGFATKQECIDALSNDYLCYSYAADFWNKNKAANDAVRDFVKQQTHGLIDQDFELSEETVFALINTLYLKDIWDYGDGLTFTEEEYDFTEGDGNTKKCNLLRGFYQKGQIYEAETFTHFFTTTLHGYRLKFILPKEGHTLDEVFTEENLALINEMTDYRAFDDEKKKRYETRCFFPEFKAEYDEDIKEILKKFGIDKLFSKEECDYSTLTDEYAYCERVQHVAKLEVNKNGIEGAAVTIVVNEGESAPGEEYELVLNDFILDRAFGFVLTDRFDTVLFSGTVNEL